MTTVDARRAPLVVRLRCDVALVDVLQWLVGTRVSPGITDPTGRVPVELRAHSELAVARQLAGFGDAIEVVSPAGVRERLADIGRALLRHHGGAA